MGRDASHILLSWLSGVVSTSSFFILLAHIDYNVWMNNLTFKRNPVKDAANLRKHGVSYGEAKTVFTDEFARLIADPDHSDDEDRFLLLGTSINSRLLVVCHCCIRKEEVIRIISARKADKRERKVYVGYRHA